MCVEVDSQNSAPDVHPDCVTFDYRSQTLNTVLGGVIRTCEDAGTFSTDGQCTLLDAALDGVINVLCECVVTDEEIELILDTMSAHHFNFVARDLSSGIHEISVLVEGTITETTDADAMVGIGNGSLTVEEVKAVNSGAGIEFQ